MKDGSVNIWEGATQVKGAAGAKTVGKQELCKYSSDSEFILWVYFLFFVFFLLVFVFF